MRNLPKPLHPFLFFIILGLVGVGVYYFSLKEPVYPGTKIYIGEGSSQTLLSVRGVIREITEKSIIIFINKDEDYTVPIDEIQEVSRIDDPNKAGEKIGIKDLSKGMVVTYLPGYGILMADAPAQ